jgi:hypothetical protein
MSNKADTALQGVMEHLPVQNVIDRLPHVPSVQAVVDHLPDRLRPAPKRRSRRPAVLAIIVLAILVAVMMRRRASDHEVVSFDGASARPSRDAAFVDVR